jgi:hypothetical protein
LKNSERFEEGEGKHYQQVDLTQCGAACRRLKQKAASKPVWGIVFGVNTPCPEMQEIFWTLAADDV